MSELQKLYENVFEYNYKLYARSYFPSTKLSITEELPNNKFVPTLYIPCKFSEAKKEGHTFKSFLNNEPLKPVNFKNGYELYMFVKNNKHISIHGNTSRAQQYVRENYSKTLDCLHDMRTWFIDIEVRSINGYATPSNPTEEISLVQIYDTFLKKFIVLGVKDWTPSITSDSGEIIYKKFNSEYEMMTNFVSLVMKLDPTLIVGFNSDLFDIPYITNRLNFIGIDANQLSPINEISCVATETFDKIKFTKYVWVGRMFLDYRDLYQKYTYTKLPRYSLEEIASYVLGEGKVPHDEFIDFEEFYIQDYQKFVEYGIKDVELLILIEEKIKLIETAKLVGYTCGVNITEVLGTLFQWSSLMYNEALKIKKILPIAQKYGEDCPYPGGWVKATPGIHRNIVSFDFSSLYPSNIQFCNISLDSYLKPYLSVRERIELEINKEQIDNNAEKVSKLMEYYFRDTLSDSDLEELGLDKYPEDLKYLKQKIFYWYKIDNIEAIKLENDNSEEFKFMLHLLENRDVIHNTLSKYGLCAAPNGTFYYKHKQGLLADLMKGFYSDRNVSKAHLKKAEKKLKELELIQKDRTLTVEETQESEVAKADANYWDLMQMMYKILMNSCYGSTSLAINPFSFGKKQSEAITTIGRMANRLVAYRVNEYIKNKANLDIDIRQVPFTIQADTDSNYFTLDYLINPSLPVSEQLQQVDKIAKEEIKPVIDKAILELAYILNAKVPEVLFMEQEKVCDKFISTAPKRYVGRYFKNGKSELKITGLSLIGKSTPKWCKEKLMPIVDIIMDKKPIDLVHYIDSVKKEFKLAKPNEICTVKSVSSINYYPKGDKYYKKNADGKEIPCPIHSRGSIIHNKIIDEKNLSYQKIKPGDKIYYCYLNIPNEVNSNVVSFLDQEILYESKLNEFIDYDKLFEKNFVANVKLITDPAGISLNPSQGVLDLWEY